MTEVWVIGRLAKHVVGHGETAEEFELASLSGYGGAAHPAFSSLDKAVEYIESIRATGWLTAKRLEVL